MTQNNIYKNEKDTNLWLQSRFEIFKFCTYNKK